MQHHGHWTVKYLLVLHTFHKPKKKKKFRAVILIIILSIFYLCTGKVFICSESKVFIVWDRALSACFCSQSYICLLGYLFIIRIIFSNALLPKLHCCKKTFCTVMATLISGVLDLLIMDRKGKLFVTLQAQICYFFLIFVIIFLTLKQGLEDLY